MSPSLFLNNFKSLKNTYNLKKKKRSKNGCVYNCPITFFVPLLSPSYSLMCMEKMKTILKCLNEDYLEWEDVKEKLSLNVLWTVVAIIISFFVLKIVRKQQQSIDYIEDPNMNEIHTDDLFPNVFYYYFCRFYSL